ncbi:Gfo/Idh/MocA family protein [Alicyclobacillus sp. SO9]|uniref:Gfo/Idh/MocA family protein n=1 Tax=Alicyclobacillus sp. SO9 TaxID=2665646 RepID=UPI0018E803BD|nr:Gfo/Idh/MocA family oxidoreductase [Alicyclobacillus sp. SO9]QQE78418.1 Gfo/Idh/MocA family oxidoreductase [Alicyclobacillus sp. SO9]
MLRVGIVGVGYFGAEFAKICGELDDVELVAVYGGRDAEETARKVPCCFETSLQNLCNRPDIDAVLITSPNFAHKEGVLEASRHSKHVFCEKPIALSLADCEEMLTACQEHSVLFMAGHILHFISGLRKVKKLIKSGVIGDPIIAHAERTGWEPKQPNISWKKRKKFSGGHLFHHIHELDFLQNIMGPAKQVHLMGGNRGHIGKAFGDEDDILLLSIEFSNGGFGTMQYGTAFHWDEHYIKINGTRGAININFQKSTVKVRDENGQITQYPLHDLPEENQARIEQYDRMHGGIVYGSPSERPPQWLSNVMRHEIAYFRDVLLGHPIDDEYNFLFDGTSARSSIHTAEKAMTSLLTHQVIDLSDSQKGNK